MTESVVDFLKIWTQHDPGWERIMKSALLDGLDAVVQGQSDVLSKIKVGKSVSTPVVRWLEEWAYPSQISARLTGD
ncbi:MAG: hypothetical protein AB1646_26715, partial [Thermodesulfobacteriota bacterium]